MWLQRGSIHHPLCPGPACHSTLSPAHPKESYEPKGGPRETPVIPCSLPPEALEAPAPGQPLQTQMPLQRHTQALWVEKRGQSEPHMGTDTRAQEAHPCPPPTATSRAQVGQPAPEPSPLGPALPSHPHSGEPQSQAHPSHAATSPSRVGVVYMQHGPTPPLSPRLHPDLPPHHTSATRTRQAQRGFPPLWEPSRPHTASPVALAPPDSSPCQQHLTEGQTITHAHTHTASHTGCGLRPTLPVKHSPEQAADPLPGLGAARVTARGQTPPSTLHTCTHVHTHSLAHKQPLHSLGKQLTPSTL